MRKMIFTLMLAIVSSVWTLSDAGEWCMPSVRTTAEPWIEVSGTFQAEGFPCEPDEVCPPCLTIVLVTSDKTYYLVTDDGQLIEYLDTIQLGTKATVSGIPFEHGSYDYIQVSHIETDRTSQLPSLCDQWNVLHEPFLCDGIYCRLQTLIYRLTTDTLIQDVNYVKLMEQEEPYTYYKGAMREGTNRDIYYVPANSTHEYLLYAFNAQVGDTLSNLWVGELGDSYQAVVQAISNGSPRIFTIGVKFGDESDDYLYPIQWIEGVGSPEKPCGLDCPPPCYADGGVYTLLCAYKNGEQVYSSSKSERYGCEFNGIPSTKPYSLCDTWNVMEVSLATSPDEVYHTVTQRLTKDTIIAYPSYYNFTPYARLEENGKYKGAMLEGESGVIYYIPAGSTHEYLLYNFNAKVGDRLTNLWYGGDPERCPNGYNATVLSISDETPRVFTIEVEYILSDSDGEHIIPWTIYWTEGVGLSDGPAGQFCPGPDCACSCGQLVLCAYKNGEQVYTSAMGEQYGCEYNGNGTPEPMFTSDTKWHYKSYDMFAYTDYTPTLSSISLVDTLINNIPYQKIGSILFRTKGTKVWCTMDSLGTSVERLVYDFGLQVGDSIRNVYYDEEFWMEQEYIRYAKVTSVEYITLSDGRSARRISYDNYRPDDIEHIGSVEGILFPLNFPVAECGCGDAFMCCTRNDFLLYEVSTGACDEFFEAEQPADTIPLFSYTGDDPGSSTVDPVDPNQVVVTLNGDKLTIREKSGVDVTYSLQHNAPSQIPSLHRAPQSDTFRDMVMLQITESGEYMLLLTNPSWGYNIFGRFNYMPQGIEQISSSSQGGKTSRLVLVNGQIFILRGEKVYTVTGQEVR